MAQVMARLGERDLLDSASFLGLQDFHGFIEEYVDGLGFCLSEDGDLLSQWRGYAADATGVAIGFSGEYLNWLCSTSNNRMEHGLTLEKVEYDPLAQESRVEPTYLKVKQSIDAGAFKTPGPHGLVDSRTPEELEQENTMIHNARSQLLQALISSPELFRLKAYAFREEREWRVLSSLVNSGEDPCSHRPVHNRIVPYRVVKLVEMVRQPITEVILGPKHASPPQVVESFLKQNDYGSVSVKRSEASYR